MGENALAPKILPLTLGNPQANKSKPKTKSRTGCVTCKTKRLKCDEHKPSCYNCQKKNITCGGYATRFKWRSFNDGKDLAAAGLEDPGDLSTSTLNKPARTVLPPDTDNHKDGMCTLAKPENAPLLLRDHIELASLSMVGKSTKDMERENELMSKGINPDTSTTRDLKRPLRRSYSTTEIIQEAPVVNKKRANSSSHLTMAPFEHNLPKNFHGLHGLHSLAESAVNELRSRCPDSKAPLFAIPQSPNTPIEHTTAAPTHSYSPKLHSFSPHNHVFSPVTQLELDAHSKELALSGVASSPGGVQEKEALGYMNLTPSLSALISHACSKDEKPEADEAMGFSHPEAALSPLDITYTPQQHDQNGPFSKQPGSLPIEGEDITYESRVFLDEVNNTLMKYENHSPSIINGASNVHLMNTSEQEQILFLFSKYTCGIMSIKSGLSENPWRSIYLPLAKRYSFFFNSIASMTLFHLAGNNHLQEQGKALRASGFVYMKRCIVELAAGLSRMENNSSCENQLPADIALATCLNLAVSETWDTHTSSGIAHLKGAKSMIQRILDIIKKFSMAGRSGANGEITEEQIKTKLVLVRKDEWQKMKEVHLAANGNEAALYIPKKILLLFNEWIYFEVLSQMTSYNAQDDKGIDLVATITKITNTHQKQKDENRFSTGSADESPAESVNLMKSSSHSNDGQFAFFDSLDTILQNNDCIDPLLGCAQSLFLVMGKVSRLISRVRKAQETGKQARNSLKNISLASELKKQLVDWKPVVPGNLKILEEQAGDSSWDIYSCVSTAEAYRYATLLYLHEAVPEVPLMTSYQLAEKVFVSLASIPSNSNLYIIHIFPLLISSCEAVSKEEREWCEARWGLLVQRLWIGNIDRAFEVVKEVWRRRDEYKREQRREKDSDEATGQDRRDAPSMSLHFEEVIKNIHNGSSRDEKGIVSRFHWSSVMREWGWEVLLA